MSRTVEAEMWEVVTSDENGAIVTIKYTCPHCGEEQYKNVFARGDVDFDFGFTVDEICDDCGEDVTVDCY